MSANLLTNTNSNIIYTETEVKEEDWTESAWYSLFHISFWKTDNAEFIIHT